MAALTVIGLGGGALVLGGTVAQLSSDAQTSGTTVAIIGAVAVVLVAIIGVVGNYMSNRKTAPSPPGADIDLPGVHNRVTVVEQNVHDIREDVHEIREDLGTINERVIPLAAVTDSKFADVYRRLDALERKQ